MCCKNFWKKVFPFAIAFTLGILASGFSQKIGNSSENQFVSKSAPKAVGYGYGTGHGSGIGGRRVEEIGTITRPGTNPLQVLSKPRPNYTDSARENGTQGIVRLRVTFLASGQIGSVLPITELPDGLTEQAIDSAKQLRFLPATENGKSISVTKSVEYNFTIY
jgi:TonB family protein